MISTRHWRVQIRLPSGGWVTVAYPPTLPEGIREAEARGRARVVLGGVVYYETGDVA